MNRKWTGHILLALAVSFAGCAKKTVTKPEPEKAGSSVTLPTAKTPIDTQYISDDFIGAVIVHPARMLNSKLTKNLLAEAEKGIGKKAIDEGIAEVKKELGVDPYKVAQVTLLVDGNSVGEAIPLFIGGGRSSKKSEFSKEDFSKDRKKGDFSKEEKKGEKDDGECLPQFKDDPDGKDGPGFGPGGDPPLPSVIVRFTQAVDQKAILSRIADILGADDGPSKEAPKQFKEPEKTTDKKPDCLDDGPDGKSNLPTNTHSGKTYHLIGPLAACFVDAKTLLAGPEKLLKKMITAKGVKSPLTQRLSTLGDEHDIVVALHVQPLTGLLKMLPREFLPPDAVAAIDFVAKIKTLAITAGITGETLVSVVAEMSSADDAKGFAELIKEKGIKKAKALYETAKADPAHNIPKDAQLFLQLIDQLVAGLSVGHKGTDVVVAIARPSELDNLPKLLGPAIKAAREAARRTSRTNNLKTIGVAMHSFHEVYNHFPAADSNGYPKGSGRKSGLSWRVYILPFIEETPLFRQFKLDEPWDSAHNKTLISKMPAVFVNPSSSRPQTDGKTSIHVFVGKNNTPFGLQLDGQSVGAKVRDITDGTFGTLMAVEAGDDKAEIWTKPGGLPFDPKKNAFDSLGKLPKGIFIGLFCDGRAKVLKIGISPETLRRLIQHNDGEPVGSGPNFELTDDDKKSKRTTRRIRSK